MAARDTVPSTAPTEAPTTGVWSLGQDAGSNNVDDVFTET